MGDRHDSLLDLENLVKIIGGHDYYDAGLAYGVDPHVVFIRNKSQSLEKSCPLLPPSLRIHFHGSNRINGQWIHYPSMQIEGGRHLLRITPVFVFFAGKRYGGLRVRAVNRPGYEGNPTPKDSFFWYLDAFSEWLKSIGHRLSTNRDNFYRESQMDMAVRHFTGDISEVEKDWLYSNRVGIAFAEEEFSTSWASRSKVEWRVNATGLGDIGFAKRLDVMTAWQELSMFLGMQLPVTVEIADPKIKRDKHGFDEWSFKKRKAK